MGLFNEQNLQQQYIQEQPLIQEEHSDDESLNDNANQLENDIKDFQNLRDDNSDNMSETSNAPSDASTP